MLISYMQGPGSYYQYACLLYSPSFLLAAAGISNIFGSWKYWELFSTTKPIRPLALFGNERYELANVSSDKPIDCSATATVDVERLPVTSRRFNSFSDMRCLAAMTKKQFFEQKCEMGN